MSDDKIMDELRTLTVKLADIARASTDNPRIAIAALLGAAFFTADHCKVPASDLEPALEGGLKALSKGNLGSPETAH